MSVRSTRIGLTAGDRMVEIDLLIERCEEECGGYIVAIPDLPEILMHVDDPPNVADLILWLHRLSRPTESATASIARPVPRRKPIPIKRDAH
jgi:hypothetical protein